MEYSIYTLYDNGSGIVYNSKEQFLREIAALVEDAKEGTYFSISIDSDAKFSNED